MTKRDFLYLKDKKRLLVIVSVFAIIVNAVDLLFANLTHFCYLIDIVTIVVIIISSLFEHFSVIGTVRSSMVIFYSLILNLLISFFTIYKTFTGTDLLGSILAMIILLPASAFIIGKRQALYIGSLLLVLLVLLRVSSENIYLIQNILFLSVVITAYTIGIYYLIYLLEERTNNEQHLLHELKINNEDKSFVNNLAFKLADNSVDNDIIPLVLLNIKQYTRAKIAIFNKYDPVKKALIVSRIEGDSVLLKTVAKIAGEKFLNVSSPVNDDTYHKILETEIGISNSLTEISFGAIPENIDKTLKNLTGITNFYAIAHVISGELYGTTFLAFKKNQSLPSVEILKAYAYLTAISLRKNIAEKALSLSEANLRCIADNISDVVHIFDMSLNSTYVSPSIFKLTGETPEDFLKRSMEEKHPPESMAKIRSMFKEETERERTSDKNKNRTKLIELELLKPDGTILMIATHLSFIRNLQGTPIGIHGVTRDITEITRVHKQLENYAQEMKAVNADKDRFVQILAHDLRNPFNVLLGISDLLVTNVDDLNKNQIHDFAKTINQTAHRTYNLLEELLLWSKTMSGKLPFKPERLSFNNECNDVILKLKANADHKNISINISSVQDIFLNADKNMIKTILRNLISNAIKFSKPDGIINISAQSIETHVMISVSDNGVGIKKEDLSKLWDPLKPFTSKGTDGEAGSGLGLLICKEFVEKHTGKIWVESEVEKGSDFNFTLPITHINYEN